MHTSIDQEQIDQKIHQFMARKSPLKTFSKAVADRLSPIGNIRNKSKGISYEKIGWHRTGEAVFSSRFQKAH